jgi:hypothetical protein
VATGAGRDCSLERTCPRGSVTQQAEHPGQSPLRRSWLSRGGPWFVLSFECLGWKSRVNAERAFVDLGFVG